jgi:hypothetical protein
VHHRQGAPRPGAGANVTRTRGIRPSRRRASIDERLSNVSQAPTGIVRPHCAGVQGVTLAQDRNPYAGMAVLTGVSPVLLVSDIERSFAYYHDQLGFHATSSVIHPTSRRRERDEAMILLAKIVPNWRIADKICNAYILRGVGRRGTRDVVD